MNSAQLSQRVEYLTDRYTDEARQARLVRTLILQAVVGTNGTANILKVVKPLLLGFTESALFTAGLNRHCESPQCLRTFTALVAYTDCVGVMLKIVPNLKEECGARGFEQRGFSKSNLKSPETGLWNVTGLLPRSRSLYAPLDG